MNQGGLTPELVTKMKPSAEKPQNNRGQRAAEATGQEESGGEMFGDSRTMGPGAAGPLFWVSCLPLKVRNRAFSTFQPKRAKATQNPSLINVLSSPPSIAAPPPQLLSAPGQCVGTQTHRFPSHHLDGVPLVVGIVQHADTHTHMRRQDTHVLRRLTGLPAQGHSWGLGGSGAPLLVLLLIESHVAYNDPGHFLGLMASRINGPQRHPGLLGTRKPHTSVAIT